MASVVNHVWSMAFLFFLAAVMLPSEARESLFFSKAVRYTSSPKKDTAAAVKETPAVKKEEHTTFTPESEHGYGLYGHGPDELSTAASATPTNYNGNYYNNGEAPSKFVNNEFPGERYAGYNNGGFANPSRSPADEYMHGNYESNVYPNSRYGGKKQGISDSRFQNNGRYFYDVDAERSGHGYDPLSEEYENYNNGNYGGGNNYGAAVNGYKYNSEADQGLQNNQKNRENTEDYVP